MNDQQTNQSDFGGTFSGSNPQTNPFTADLKGEFTSNFGTNTNAVSQIFKDGGFSSQSPTKLIIAGIVLVVAAIGLGLFFLSDSETKPETLPFDTETADLSEDALKDDFEDVPMADTAISSDKKAQEGAPISEPQVSEEAIQETFAAPAARSAPTGSGMVSLIAPADGQSWQYDETMEGAPFQWEGGGSIIFSRSSSMSPEYMRISARSGSYMFKNPYPGTWFWQVENADGRSEVRRFTVADAPRRNLTLSQPVQGGSLAGEGGVVSWQGDNKIAFYRVEFSSGSFANPQYRFATSGNSVQVSGMAPGQYQMRVGGFSEVSGRWEYSSPVSISVQ